MFREYNFFWTTMELCDWDQEGDDDKVLKPVIEYLSNQEDYIIFEFDDLMSELLYHDAGVKSPNHRTLKI